MIDISKYTYKEDIKPILKYVKVENNQAVATDSFRIAILDIPENYSEVIKDGLYTKEKWKAITKEINQKKPDLSKIEILVKESMLYQPELEPYPDFKRIIPSEDELINFNASLPGVNINYFNDFLSDVVISENIRHDNIFWNRIKQNDKMYVYMKEGIILLLMGLSKE